MNIVTEIETNLWTSSNGSNSIYVSYQKKRYYFASPTMLQLKNKQGSTKGEQFNNRTSLKFLIQDMQQLVTPLRITSKDVLLAFNHNHNAQARTFEDTVACGLEDIITRLQLIHEAIDISRGMKNSLTAGNLPIYLTILRLLENGYFMIIQKPFINS